MFLGLIILIIFWLFVYNFIVLFLILLINEIIVVLIVFNLWKVEFCKFFLGVYILCIMLFVYFIKNLVLVKLFVLVYIIFCGIKILLKKYLDGNCFKLFN